MQHGIQRRIEWRDGANDANRKAHGETDALVRARAGGKRHNVTHQARRFLGRQIQRDDGPVNFTRRIRHGETGFGHHHVDELIASRGDELARQAQNPRPLGRRRSSGQNCPLRCRHCLRDLGPGGTGHFGYGQRRILVQHGESGFTLYPLSVDQRTQSRPRTRMKRFF
ncbi:hypothetical protein D3C72_1383110 [compost metagenome]